MPLWRRSTLAVRPLVAEDREAALEVCRRDAVGSVLAGVQAERLGSAGPPGAELLGIFDPDDADARPAALCWAGANLVPVQVYGTLLDDLVEYVRRRGRRCSSIVGPADQVLPLWERLAPAWSRPREVRRDQPSMVIDTDPAVEPDPRVRLATPDEVALVLPASVAMFTEEVGYDPTLVGASYAARVAELVGTERTYVRVEDDGEGPRVIFKADVGALALGVAQIQGVWVHPELRGRGLATAGMAAVVADVRARLAPVASLYVNDYNTPALRAYRRVGFRQVGSYATVLF
ncbi:GNAT family N-acetyltransferase [Georgenia sp. AZ-5]|uniref:GNAT family N-acetyltransferase n=1 Tax=Georgenia sp. AZ-5 TaxID=3367526 RepID=UPI003754ACCE